MPWCDPCSLYHAPTALDDGACPDCGEAVSNGEHNGREHDERTVGQSAPWHFWIVVAALVAYIGWRIIDVVMRLL